eukprot:733209-Rhodomonas_salina.7
MRHEMLRILGSGFKGAWGLGSRVENSTSTALPGQEAARPRGNGSKPAARRGIRALTPYQNPKRSPVLNQRMEYICLRALFCVLYCRLYWYTYMMLSAYAMPGTDIAYGASHN